MAARHHLLLRLRLVSPSPPPWRRPPRSPPHPRTFRLTAPPHSPPPPSPYPSPSPSTPSSNWELCPSISPPHLFWAGRARSRGRCGHGGQPRDRGLGAVEVVRADGADRRFCPSPCSSMSRRWSSSFVALQSRSRPPSIAAVARQMSVEFQVPPLLVPTRETYFVRYC